MSFKRLIIFILSATVLCSSFAISASAKEYAYSVEVTNNVSLSEVNVELREYSLNADNERIPFVAAQNVLPGQTVNRIVEIYNSSNDAWIRVKVIHIAPEGFIGMSDDDIHITGEKWKKIGEYYYLTDYLPYSETVNFMDRFTVPSSWGNEYSRQQFSMIIQVDAVQKRNFIPDFESENPWYGTIIEQSMHDSYVPSAETEPCAFTVEFRGGSEGMIKNADDLFSNWKELLPGDRMTDSVELSNKYSSTTNWYMDAYIPENAEMSQALTEKLILKITNGNKTIFEGQLSEIFLKKISLGKLSPSKSMTLNYELYVPNELNNAYALTKAQVVFVFGVNVETSFIPFVPRPDDGGETPDKPTDPVTPTDPDKPENPANPENPGEKPQEPDTPPKEEDLVNVQTGDSIIAPIFMLAGGAVLVVGVVLSFTNRKEKDEDEK